MPVERTDDGGLMFAVKAPGQVAAQTTSGASVRRGSRSGNPNFDPASGRFASKQNKAPREGAPVNPVVVNPSGLPQGVTQEEWDRRKDAVKDAARTFEEITDENASELLKTRVDDLSKVDVQAFIADAKQQQLDDLADILAQQLGGNASVAVKGPRNYDKRVLAKLDDAQVAGLLRRLISRGFTEQEVVKKVVKKIDKDRRDTILSQLGEKDVKLAESPNGNDAKEFTLTLGDLDLTSRDKILLEAIKGLTAPEIKVEPIINVELPRATKKIVKRDDRGMIESVEEVSE